MRYLKSLSLIFLIVFSFAFTNIVFPQNLLINGIEADSYAESHFGNNSSFNEESIGELEKNELNGSLDQIIKGVLSSNRFVFLYFYSELCYFCQLEKPIIDDLEASYSGEIVFISIDGDKDSEAMLDFGVTSFPAMILIHGREGEEYLNHTFIGFHEKKVLEKSLSNIISRSTFGLEMELTTLSVDAQQCDSSLVSQQFSYMKDQYMQKMSSYIASYQQSLGFMTDTGQIQNLYLTVTGNVGGPGSCGDLAVKTNDILIDAILAWKQSHGSDYYDFYWIARLGGLHNYIAVTPAGKSWKEGSLFDPWPEQNAVIYHPGHFLHYKSIYLPSIVQLLHQASTECDGDGDGGAGDGGAGAGDGTGAGGVSPGPGGDHPDDSFDVSASVLRKDYGTASIAAFARAGVRKNLEAGIKLEEMLSTILRYGPTYNYTNDMFPEFTIEDEIALNNGAPDIAILLSGFYQSSQDLIWRFNEPVRFVDVNFDPFDLLANQRILVVSSGGLYGLDSSPTFKSKVEQYVSGGGNNHCFCSAAWL